MERVIEFNLYESYVSNRTEITILVQNKIIIPMTQTVVSLEIDDDLWARIKAQAAIEKKLLKDYVSQKLEQGLSKNR